MKVTKTSPIFVDNMIVVINAKKTGRSLNKKTFAFIYHFLREYVSTDVVEFLKIETKGKYVDLFTKTLVSNEFRGFYHECMVNG